MIKNDEGEKSVMVIVHKSGMTSHPTITIIFKNKNKMIAVQGSSSLKATRLSKNLEGPISDKEKLTMIWIKDQTEKYIPLNSMRVMTKEKKNCHVEKKKRLALPMLLNLLIALNFLKSWIS